MVMAITTAMGVDGSSERGNLSGKREGGALRRLARNKILPDDIFSALIHPAPPLNSCKTHGCFDHILRGGYA
jgi:hypothetical protein